MKIPLEHACIYSIFMFIKSGVVIIIHGIFWLKFIFTMDYYYFVVDIVLQLLLQEPHQNCRMYAL